MHEILLKNVKRKHVFGHIFMQILMSFHNVKLKQQICYNITLRIPYNNTIVNIFLPVNFNIYFSCSKEIG